MKPVDFTQRVPRSLAVAITELGAHTSDHTKVIAGGQSLGPLMNLRLARPQTLIDLSRLGELKRCYSSESSVFIGATTTHAEIEDGKVPDIANGFVRHVAGGIAYRAVRNRGTIGGSLAHADPAADWLTTLTALNARVHTQRLPDVTEQATLSIPERLKPSLGLGQSPHTRTIELVDLVLGAYTTTLTSNEIITQIEIPIHTTLTRWGYYKITRKVGELADAIGAVVVDPGRRYCRVVAGALGGAPLVLDDIATSLAQRVALPALDEIKAAIATQTDALDDTTLHQAGVSVSRAIREVLAS